MTENATSWLLGTVVAVSAALAGVILLGRLLGRLARRRPALAALVDRSRAPARCTVALAALRVRLEEAPVAGVADGVVTQLTGAALIVAVAWLATRALAVLESSLLGRFDIARRDNLHARTRRTQVQVLRRVANVAVIVLAGLVLLLSFPWGRQVGTSVLAAGGIIGVVAGVAGRSTIGNLIAGLQIAATEPMRIEDVVVVEGEWGNVEEITLTYVTVRLWDQRRLVLPASYFVEQPFQNWTRRTAEVLGSVHVWVDQSAPVDAIRAHVDQVVAGSERWDGRTLVVQVVDTSPHAMQLRVLVSAADAPTAWDLRCEVREELLAWLARHHPDALPRLRTAGVHDGAGVR